MTTVCKEVDLYQNLNTCVGQVNLAGMRNHAFFTRKANVLTLPKPAGAEAADISKAAVIVEDIELAADKTFLKLQLVPNESEVKSEQQGAWGSYYFLNTVNLVLPGTEEEVTGTIYMLNNDDVIMLVPQRNGKYRLIGNDAFQVNVKPAQNWGKAAADSRQTVIEVSVEDEFPSPFYQGVIHTADGDFSGLDGSLVVPPETGG